MAIDRSCYVPNNSRLKSPFGHWLDPPPDFDPFLCRICAKFFLKEFLLSASGLPPVVETVRVYLFFVWEKEPLPWKWTKSWGTGR